MSITKDILRSKLKATQAIRSHSVMSVWHAPENHSACHMTQRIWNLEDGVMPDVVSSTPLNRPPETTQERNVLSYRGCSCCSRRGQINKPPIQCLLYAEIFEKKNNIIPSYLPTNISDLNVILNWQTAVSRVCFLGSLHCRLYGRKSP